MSDVKMFRQSVPNESRTTRHSSYRSLLSHSSSIRQINVPGTWKRRSPDHLRQCGSIMFTGESWAPIENPFSSQYNRKSKFVPKNLSTPWCIDAWQMSLKAVNVFIDGNIASVELKTHTAVKSRSDLVNDRYCACRFENWKID